MDDLSAAELAWNHALYQTYEKKRNGRFGVYRGRLFVHITKKTGLLERIKYFFFWLIGLLSYQPKAINDLKTRIEKKGTKSEATKCLEEKLQASEEEVKILRGTNQSWVEANQQIQKAQEKYEALHKQLQEQQTGLQERIQSTQREKDQLTIANMQLDFKMKQKQSEVDALQGEVIKLRRELRIKK